VTDPGQAGSGAAWPARSPTFPGDDVPLYTIGQVSGMLGVQAAFLRRLETEEVVAPRRSAGGQRRYSRDEIDRIGAVTVLLSEGITLRGAKRIVELQAEMTRLRSLLRDGGTDTGAARGAGTA